MAKLRSRARRRLRASSFAYPKQRKYPIHDISHARNALARAKQRGTYGSYSHVRRKVVARYPSLKKTARRRSR